MFLKPSQVKIWRSSQQAKIYFDIVLIETKKITQQTKTTEVTNFEAITDRKKIFTEKHWLKYMGITQKAIIKRI